MTQMHKANKFVFCDVKAPAFSVSVFWHHLCYIAYQLLYSRVPLLSSWCCIIRKSRAISASRRRSSDLSWHSDSGGAKELFAQGALAAPGARSRADAASATPMSAARAELLARHNRTTIIRLFDTIPGIESIGATAIAAAVAANGHHSRQKNLL
jgi:hypothetical protein